MRTSCSWVLATWCLQCTGRVLELMTSPSLGRLVREQECRLHVIRHCLSMLDGLPEVYSRQLHTACLWLIVREREEIVLHNR